MSKKKKDSGLIAVAAVIVGIAIFLGIVIYGGGLQSIGFIGGKTAYKNTVFVPMEFTIGTAEWNYALSTTGGGYSCDDLKGKYYIYISSHGGLYKYKLTGQRQTTSYPLTCTGDPTGGLYCAEIGGRTFDFSAACKARTSQIGRLADFAPSYASTGSVYTVIVKFVSSTKNAVIFPFNSLTRQSSTFTVSCDSGYEELADNLCKKIIITPTPTIGATATAISTPTPTVCVQVLTCGVDGTTYSTPCDAMNLGGGILRSGACPTPPPAEITTIPTGTSTPSPPPKEEELPIVDAEKCNFIETFNDEKFKCEPDYLIIGLIAGMFLIVFVLIYFLFRRR